MGKLGPVQEVLVHKDDDWEEWGLEKLVENLQKYVERKPLRANEDKGTKTTPLRTAKMTARRHAHGKEIEREKMIYGNNGEAN